MIIEVVIFFAWILLVLVIGGIIAWYLQRRRKLKLQAIDNVENEQRLSFPQRNWLLLCIAVAIISPLAVSWLGAAAHKKSYRESMATMRQDSLNGRAGATSSYGDTSSHDTTARDTSYHVATPPKN